MVLFMFENKTHFVAVCAISAPLLLLRLGTKECQRNNIV